MSNETNKSPGQLAYEFHVGVRKIEPPQSFMEWHEMPQEGKGAWEQTAAFMAGKTAQTVPEVQSASESVGAAMIKYLDECSRAEKWPQRAEIEQIINEHFTPFASSPWPEAPTPTQPQAGEQREAFEKWAHDYFALTPTFQWDTTIKQYEPTKVHHCWLAWTAAQSASAPTGGGFISQQEHARLCLQIAHLTAADAKLTEERDEYKTAIDKLAEASGILNATADSLVDSIISERDLAARAYNRMSERLGVTERAAAEVAELKAQLSSLQWVSVSDRLPTPSDLDEHGEVMWAHNTFSWRGKLAGRNAATHWRRIDLPKSEEKAMDYQAKSTPHLPSQPTTDAIHGARYLLEEFGPDDQLVINITKATGLPAGTVHEALSNVFPEKDLMPHPRHTSPAQQAKESPECKKPVCKHGCMFPQNCPNDHEQPTDPLAAVKAHFAKGGRVQCCHVAETSQEDRWLDCDRGEPQWAYDFSYRIHPDDLTPPRESLRKVEEERDEARQSSKSNWDEATRQSQLAQERWETIHKLQYEAQSASDEASILRKELAENNKVIERLRADRPARINTRCPACDSQTLVIGSGGLLVCSLIGCPDPTLINELWKQSPYRTTSDDLTPPRETCPTCGSSDKAIRESVSKANCGPPLFPCTSEWHTTPEQKPWEPKYAVGQRVKIKASGQIRTIEVVSRHHTGEPTYLCGDCGMELERNVELAPSHHLPPWAKDDSVLHNPAGLTPEQVGEGYRLLLKSEFGRSVGARNKHVEAWRADAWDANQGKGYMGDFEPYSYRLPSSTPWPDAPSATEPERVARLYPWPTSMRQLQESGLVQNT